MSNKKLCEISDLIPVRVFPNSRKKMGPIGPMYMSDSLIFSILNSRPAPVHFYAVNPRDKSKRVLLTKGNYNKTTEELFPEYEVAKDTSDKKDDVPNQVASTDEPVPVKMDNTINDINITNTTVPVKTDDTANDINITNTTVTENDTVSDNSEPENTDVKNPAEVDKTEGDSVPNTSNESGADTVAKTSAVDYSDNKQKYSNKKKKK